MHEYRNKSFECDNLAKRVAVAAAEIAKMYIFSCFFECMCEFLENVINHIFHKTLHAFSFHRMKIKFLFNYFLRLYFRGVNSTASAFELYLAASMFVENELVSYGQNEITIQLHQYDWSLQFTAFPFSHFQLI